MAPGRYSSIKIPVMIVGTMSDKLNKRAVSQQEGLDFAREMGCEFLETSAKEAINVPEVFHDVVQLSWSLEQRTNSPGSAASIIQAFVDFMSMVWMRLIALICFRA